MIVFAQHNLISDAPFTKLDYVSCRNLLIYFQPDTQTRVLSLFHYALKKHGVLFLGPSETLSDLSKEFETLDNHWKLYRKKRDVRLPRELQLPKNADLSSRTSVPPLPSSRTFSPNADRSLASAYDTLLETLHAKWCPAG